MRALLALDQAAAAYGAAAYGALAELPQAPRRHRRLLAYARERARCAELASERLGEKVVGDARGAIGCDWCG